MKNKHLLLLWEEASTSRREELQKIAKIYEYFLLCCCKFYINKFRSISQQIPLDVTARHHTDK